MNTDALIVGTTPSKPLEAALTLQKMPRLLTDTVVLRNGFELGKYCLTFATILPQHT